MKYAYVFKIRCYKNRIKTTTPTRMSMEHFIHTHTHTPISQPLSLKLHFV